MLVADTVNEVGVEYFDNFDSTVFRFTIVDADGTVLYDTQAKADEMENHAGREEIIEAFETGEGSSARNSETLTEKTFYEATTETVELMNVAYEVVKELSPYADEKM